MLRHKMWKKKLNLKATENSHMKMHEIDVFLFLMLRQKVSEMWKKYLNLSATEDSPTKNA